MGKALYSISLVTEQLSDLWPLRRAFATNAVRMKAHARRKVLK